MCVRGSELQACMASCGVKCVVMVLVRLSMALECGITLDFGVSMPSSSVAVAYIQKLICE